MYLRLMRFPLFVTNHVPRNGVIDGCMLSVPTFTPVSPDGVSSTLAPLSQKKSPAFQVAVARTTIL